MAVYPQEPYRRPEPVPPRWSIYVLTAVVIALLLVYGVPYVVQRIVTAVYTGQALGARAGLKGMPAMDAVSEKFRMVAKAVRPAVVHIATSKTVAGGQETGMINPFFGPSGPAPRLEERALGSGVIMDSHGYILTNNHVVAGASQIMVQLGDGRQVSAKVVGTDPNTDLAVIKIHADMTIAADFGDSEKIAVGDWVLAIGNPFGLDQTVTAGIISATGRQNLALSKYEDFIQTDAAINPGNSGGPLVDLAGKVIGINTAIFSESGGYMGIGFAIPSNMARTVFSELVKNGKVVRGYLGVGIQNLTPAIAENFKLSITKGAIVTQVQPGSPAAKAGLKPMDVITRFNGHPVTSADQLRLLVAATGVGKSVEIVYLRQGQTKTTTATIQEQPTQMTLGPSAQGLHFQVQTLTPELAASLGYAEDAQGVVVSHVDPSSNAYRAGLRTGLLIVGVGPTDIATKADFDQAIKDHDPSKALVLRIQLPNGTSGLLTIPPG